MRTQHINKRIIRGDKNTVTWKYEGQLPYSDTYLTVKKTTKVTDKRLIDVVCETAFDEAAKITTITAVISAEQTAQLDADTYKYDISNHGTDTEEYTPFVGDLILFGDVRSPFDGFPLPEDYERIILLDTENYNDNTLLIFKTAEGFVPISLEALSMLLGNGNYDFLTPEFDPYNPDAVTPNVDGLTEKVDNKVDKIEGKGLSTEDYTTAEKDKLAGVADNANNYVHPASHPATMIDEDTTHRFVTDTEKSTWNGKADLEDGKVPASQLPSFVDDVLEYAEFASLPVTGETGKIYVTIDDGKTFRWSGSAYAEISSSLALGETSSTAYRGDRGKTAYDHSQSPHAPADAQKNSDITKAEIEAKLTGDISSHSHANLPTADEKAALPGTAGTPSGTNKYVTNEDTRLTNERTPSDESVSYLKLTSDLKSLMLAYGFVYQDNQMMESSLLPNNYAVIDQHGNPHWMVEIPRKNWDPSNIFASSDIHPAFTVNDTQKRIMVGKVQLSELPDGKYVTWLNRAVKHSLNFDQSLAAINQLNGGGITGFHMTTNAEYALLALITKAANQMPYGNNNYGRDVDDKSITGIIEPGYEANFGSTSPARWLAGSGGILTSHDRTPAGIYDLNGNVWEWVGGFRLVDGEIQILANNNAADYTKDLSASSTEWKAILEDGTLVAPGTADTLKFDASSPGSIATTIVNQDVDPDYQYNDFEAQTTALSGAGIDLLKKLAIHPYTTGLNSDRIYFRNYGERLPFRGGSWVNSTYAGVFALSLGNLRSLVNNSVGCRAAFVL